MAKLSISAAARAVGKNRTTIYRHIEKGLLSTTKDVRGNHKIDTAELMRVFGEIESSGDSIKATQVNTEQQATIELLKQQLESAEVREKKALEREERLYRELDDWKERYTLLENRMLPPAPAEQAIPMEPTPAEPIKKGFFSRLFG